MATPSQCRHQDVTILAGHEGYTHATLLPRRTV